MREGSPLAKRRMRPFVEGGRRLFVKGGRRPFAKGGRRPFAERGGHLSRERGGHPPRGEAIIKRGRRPFVERGEKTSACGKGEACDTWTEQVRELHLNNTLTHFKTLTHLHPLYMHGASSSGFSRY